MTDAEILRQSVPLGFIRRWEAEGWDLGADWLPVFADALEEAGYSDVGTLAALRSGRLKKYHPEAFREALCLPELAVGDWQYVFAYAGEPDAGDGSATIRKAADHLPDVSLEPFSRWDVGRVIAQQDGDNDGPDWVCVGELRDGRFFAINAGCDYTGWG